MDGNDSFGASGVKHDIILLDPPWPYFEHHDKRQPFADDHYGLMTQQEIEGLDVDSVASNNCIVFVWATSPKLDLAIHAIKSWGFEYRNIAHTWVKTRKDGLPLNGCGPRGTYAKPQTELLLFATRKKKGRPLPVMIENTPQQILAQRGKHSSKPEVFQDWIDKTYASEHPRIELFARRHRKGWTCTGLELTGHDYRVGSDDR